MNQLESRLCAFCILIRGIEESGEMTREDVEKFRVHLRIAHGLKPYVIEP